MKNFARPSIDRRDEMEMVARESCLLKRCLLAGLLLILAAPSARAQSDEDRNTPVPPDQFRKAMEVMDTAKKIGPWENQYRILEDATNNIFDQQGWNSESDQFARGVMREVGRVPPWDPAARQKVFLDQLQGRYNLTHDQVSQFDKEFQAEGMRMAFKHFATIAPVAMEIVKTRASGEPFTAEQVQRWSQQGRPIMDDVMNSMERVTGKLESTMSTEQRAALDGDMKAFRRRHSDMKRMADKWAAGQWTPADWGLQNDPVHSAAMSDASRIDAEKTELVNRVMNEKRPDEDAISRDESEWDRYVKWFCTRYHCDERQRTTAGSILQSSKREAVSYMSAKRDLIQQAQNKVKMADDPESRKEAMVEQDHVMKPVIITFERLKRRLFEDVLTSEQQRKYTPPAKTVKAERKSESAEKPE